MLRSILIAGLGLAALSGTPAVAHDECRGNCYREALVPAGYGLSVEKQIVRAPRTYAIYAPAEYRTVRETVMVRPAGRRWAVKPDAFGNPVGCWVETPAAYATVQRQVLARPAVLQPFVQTTAYGISTRPVLVEPPHTTWVPLRP